MAEIKAESQIELKTDIVCDVNIKMETEINSKNTAQIKVENAVPEISMPENVLEIKPCCEAEFKTEYEDEIEMEPESNYNISHTVSDVSQY